MTMHKSATEQKIGTGKTLAFFMPEDFSLGELIAENFSHHGFEVIYFKRPKFSYRNIYDRIINGFRKIFLKDFDYKNRKPKLEQYKSYKSALEKIDKVDYAFFIRADFFDKEFIEFVKSHSKHTINYQWDGMSRFPDIFDRVYLFDDFFVFDKKDLQKHPNLPLKVSNNFYFDFDDKQKNELSVQNKKSIYFIGSHIDERAVIIDRFLSVMAESDFEVRFLISAINKEEVMHLYGTSQERIIWLTQTIDSRENLNNVKNSDILVDFVNPTHSGLSFRVFESLHFNKKLITDNKDIRYYDIYHENNIFILDENFNVEELKRFIDTPYKNLDEFIYEKYAFKNWLKYMLNINPHIPFS